MRGRMDGRNERRGEVRAEERKEGVLGRGGKGRLKRKVQLESKSNG